MKYLRRLAAFAAKKLVIITLIACLAVYAFYLAFNYSNAYIIGLYFRKVKIYFKPTSVFLLFCFAHLAKW